MSHVRVAVLDTFNPKIKAEIEKAIPPTWSVRFTNESTLTARAAVLHDATIAFAVAAPTPAALLSEAKHLRFIQKLGAGVDRIDLDGCRKRGIAVARLHAGNSVPVAEHTILLMLAVYRQELGGAANQRRTQRRVRFFFDGRLATGGLVAAQRRFLKRQLSLPVSTMSQ
jgi:phosphoglycerate dehydrogenase-like enzyme